MKIIVIPGVGFQTNIEEYKSFANKIKSNFNCDYEIFNWDHTPIKVSGLDIIKKIKTTISKKYSISKPQEKQKKQENEISFDSLRKLVIEIILDFEYVLKYGEQIDIPDGDYYIGHSAGSFFALAQDKPSTIMGSPATIIKHIEQLRKFSSLFTESILNNDKNILNIVNKYDILSYPIYEDNIKNIYFHGNILNPISYCPLTAHTSYWNSNFVIKEIVKHLKYIFPKSQKNV